MRTQPSSARKRLGFATAALAAGLLLTACGDNHDHSETPVPVVDSFFAYVSALVAPTLDSGEPVDIDAVAVTAPDNTEPEAVQ